jgi:chromosome partitioning protein
VQKSFDLVIIDAPPRLSTATVNAFCASTHVLIPTILDSMSTQAALNTLGVVRQFRQMLNPGLEVLGIVPTLVSQTQLNNREMDSLERMVARLPDYWRQAPGPHVFEEQRIYRREAIATALGADLAFTASPQVRQMATLLGDAITERLFAHADEPIGDAPSRSGNITPISTARRRA